MEKVTTDFTKVLSEVYVILQYLPKEEFEKVPLKLRNLIEENRNLNYVFEYDNGKTLINQDIYEETKDFISGIYITYICQEEEKLSIIKKCKENDVKFEEELNRKYNTDNLFKKPDNAFKQENRQERNQEEQTQIMVIEEKWYTKIINKIKNIFKK